MTAVKYRFALPSGEASQIWMAFYVTYGGVLFRQAADLDPQVTNRTPRAFSEKVWIRTRDSSQGHLWLCSWNIGVGGADWIKHPLYMVSDKIMRYSDLWWAGGCHSQWQWKEASCSATFGLWVEFFRLLKVHTVENYQNRRGNYELFYSHLSTE